MWRVCWPPPSLITELSDSDENGPPSSQRRPEGKLLMSVPTRCQLCWIMMAGVHNMEINCQSGSFLRSVNAARDKMLTKLCGQTFVLRPLLGLSSRKYWVSSSELTDGSVVETEPEILGKVLVHYINLPVMWKSYTPSDLCMRNRPTACNVL